MGLLCFHLSVFPLFFLNAPNPYLFILKYLYDQFKCTASREEYNLGLALGNIARETSGKLEASFSSSSWSISSGNQNVYLFLH